MLTFADSKIMTRKQLDRVPVTDRRGGVSDRWRGIQHGELADKLIERTEAFGFAVKSERWGTFSDGAGLVGAVDLAPTPKLRIEIPRGLVLSLGVRHSNDGRLALQFLAGAKVLVCANGMISEVFNATDRRRHTTGVVLADEIDEGLGHFAEGVRAGLVREVKALQGIHLDREVLAHHLIVEAGKRGIVPWSELGKVEKLWRTPPHPEFKPRNAWSLYNAFTEVAKEFSPSGQIRTLSGTRQLISAKAKEGFFRDN